MASRCWTASLGDPRLQLADAARGEALGHQGAQPQVRRVVHREERHRLAGVRSARDRVERDAVAVGQRRAVAEALQHVAGAATAPRSRALRCGTAAPRRAAACSTGTDPRGSRSRTGRGSDRSASSHSESSVFSEDEADHIAEAVGDLVVGDGAAAGVDQRAEVRHLQRRDACVDRRPGRPPSGCGGGSRRRCGRGPCAPPRRRCSAGPSCRRRRPRVHRQSSASARGAPSRRGSTCCR